MASLHRLVRQLRDAVGQITALPFADLASVLSPDEREPIRDLDAKIAAECSRLNVAFPALPVAPNDDPAIREFGFVRLPYIAVKAQRSSLGIQKPGWRLLPSENWWQCLSILESLADPNEQPESKGGKKSRSKKRGRKQLSAAETHKRTVLIQQWHRAKEAHIAQKDFCDDKGVKIKDLRRWLEWAGMRRRRS